VTTIREAVESIEPDCFYRPVDDDIFESTTATTSPWDPQLQHGGPPSALLARTIEAVPADDRVVTRFTVDFFGGVPQGRLRTSVEVVRPGRRIELLEASLADDTRIVATARAWRVRPSADSPASSATTRFEPPPPLPAAQPQEFFAGIGPDWGYGRAIEWRFVLGGYTAPGRALVWTRQRLPLVAGEPASGLQRMLVVADSINGLSAVLDLKEWLFVPPGLTLTAHRVEAGEWLLVDASTVLDPSGVALAHGSLADQQGQLALVSQPLLVQRR
jgi:Thioesterase-like superfamily